METVVKKKTGFASMSKERVREIASMGGRKATELGTRYKFTSEKAKEAGKKGGHAAQRRRQEMKAKETAESTSETIS